MGFVCTKFQNCSEDWPDVQLFLASYADSTDGGLFSKRAAGLTDDYYTAVYEEIVYQEAYTIMPLLLRPLSRGRILLRDSNPKSHPVIVPNYFAHPHDLEVLVSL